MNMLLRGAQRARHRQTVALNAADRGNAGVA